MGPSRIVVLLLVVLTSTAFARPMTFEGIKLDEPEGWKKTDDAAGLRFINNAGNTFMVLTKRRTGDRDPNKNFTTGWSTILQPLIKVAPPAADGSSVVNGWTLVSGKAGFTADGQPGVAMLVTATAGTNVMHMIIVTTTDKDAAAIQKFVGSIQLPDMTTAASPPPTATKPGAGTEVERLYAKWNHTTSGQGNLSDTGYATSRYEFGRDGTYRFTERAFWASVEHIVIVEEAGKFTLDGDRLTLSPTTSTVSSYEKAGGVDTLGTRTSSKARPLERVTYHFAFHYFEGIKQWNLVLQPDAPTTRDGPFSTNTTYKNAYYFDQQWTDKDLTAVKAK